MQNECEHCGNKIRGTLLELNKLTDDGEIGTAVFHKKCYQLWWRQRHAHLLVSNNLIKNHKTKETNKC